tara:strand:- start:43790 stop:44827 length:1038 start_codon:yes stop_codon:yes gene_type:complete
MLPYALAKLLLFRLDPEKAHHLTLDAMNAAQRLGLLSTLAGDSPDQDSPRMVMGLKFPNAVGLAAGMDKSGIAVDAFGAIGFGHVEVGTVTPRAQPGNPKPRLFRLPEHEAIINRMGFNNPGMEAVLNNLNQRSHFKGILGVNIGKNFDTPNENAIDDYVKGFRGAYPTADYIAVNLSSPNTKGLRDLQAIDSCKALIKRLQEERIQLEDETGLFRPIAVKLAPDLSDEQTKGLANMLSELEIDAVIVTNTTIDKTAVQGHPMADEAGGLSGRPLKERSMECLQVWRCSLDPKIPIISVGGILNGATARERLEAGAALVQVYTGLVYRGPSLVHDILRETQLLGA